MKHLAIDIGAESGRGILGWIEDKKIQIEEVHRFQNGPVVDGDRIYWDIDRIYDEVIRAIGQCKKDIASVGIDTWAVDYVLLDEQGVRLDRPRCYRDPRTDDALPRALEKVGADLYRLTGIQLLPFNTIFQLMSEEPEVFAHAATLLTIPDYLNYRLTGVRACEFTNATTTQCYNPTEQDWARDLLARLNIPSRIFPPLVRPGTILGPLPDCPTQVVAVASHDTGSAVAGTPLTPNSAWISSGTWSIMGVEVPEPIINEHSLRANFTNEGGVNNTFRFSKNVAGLWLLQQCRAAWGEQFSYEELCREAEQVPFGETIDPDDPDFFAPGNMPAKISAKLSKPTEDKAETVRIILDSLAKRYAEVLTKLEDLTGHKLERIHIVGGGSRNWLLNQLTANACKRPVAAGPVEATAIGNMLVQMIALGQIASIEEGRALVASSFSVKTYEPQ